MDFKRSTDATSIEYPAKRARRCIEARARDDQQCDLFGGLWSALGQKQWDAVEKHAYDCIRILDRWDGSTSARLKTEILCRVLPRALVELGKPGGYVSILP